MSLKLSSLNLICLKGRKKERWWTEFGRCQRNVQNKCINKNYQESPETQRHMKKDKLVSICKYIIIMLLSHKQAVPKREHNLFFLFWEQVVFGTHSFVILLHLALQDQHQIYTLTIHLIFVYFGVKKEIHGRNNFKFTSWD